MACNPDFVQFIIDQCSGAGEIAVKKMMGDWCAYCDGVLFGLICDNNFYIKVTEPGKDLLKEIILRPPYDGAKMRPSCTISAATTLMVFIIPQDRVTGDIHTSHCRILEGV